MRLFNGKKEENFIFYDISDHVILMQLIDTDVKANYVLSNNGCWIYDSNFKKASSFMK